MEKSHKKSGTLKFKYIFTDDYNPVYVNGAYGGVTPKNELVANFFFERQGLPISQTHHLKDGGLLGNEVEKEPEDYEDSMVRFVSTGIILNLENAKSINSWLTNQIKNLEEKMKNEKQMRGIK